MTAQANYARGYGEDERGGVRMTEKELFCLGWHFVSFYAYSVEEKVPNFGMPCSNCKFYTECWANWDDTRESLKRETGITVPIMNNSKVVKALTEWPTVESMELIKKLFEGKQTAPDGATSEAEPG